MLWKHSRRYPEWQVNKMDELTGIITFFSSHDAVRSEKELKERDYQVKLVPGPKDISPNCGIALRFEYGFRDEVVDILKKKKINIDGVHERKEEEKGKESFLSRWKLRKKR